MASTWRVTGDAPDAYEFDGAGNAVPGHAISFVTGEGFKGSVFVPNEHYNATTVRNLIAKQAAVVDDINSLQSS
jgi:hypothetical protein